MRQTFKVKKNNFWILIVVVAFLPFYMLINVPINDIWYLLPAFIPAIMLLWAYSSTKYYILEDHFYYQSAFLKGKIHIHKIKELKLNTTLWSGIKPALSTKGVIIKFGYDEVYVSPINNEEFANALTAINPNIIIKY